MVDQPHHPVLLEEVVEAMNIREDGYYLDATAGRGGHVSAILEKLGSDGRILALDRDPQAVAAVTKRFISDSRVQVRQANFSSLSATLQQGECFSGILFDFGVSSPQLDDASRGFSFMQDGPLDMRMNPADHPSAAEWLATAEQHEIRDVLRRYGEEKHAHRIAWAIVDARNDNALETTAQLVALIKKVVPVRPQDKHPATRSFQAIRIHINRELEEIAAVLPVALEALCVGGRLLAISFHSLEDRIVKRFLRDQARGDDLPKEIPIRDAERNPGLRLVGKPVRASVAEIDDNPRARSAIMRVAERLPLDREVA
ncbi:MAG TPA: 16S rRNA (cytosine(1402)-N(4))-methyltransferase RsmH [Gammaproteobacteria bacterium]|nr:ribosomal RNA small subunit methyltransferase H [bacterium BMS3Abin11]GMT40001.1 MAG: ribosomal RNA small subunit methyltransferase H [bacterium]HDH15639.1 16S rRNA (cytosine(1402)-N(4))-methyltransferase RsmH [Gammaproteobacteria bacterium]HDZ79026.1 16S rRNA (cytosine(1402)-N(4))-methyltransferase RsmH [Gammaproteobacteria bacterium]